MNAGHRSALAATIRQVQDRLRSSRVQKPSEEEIRAWVEWASTSSRVRRRRWVLSLAIAGAVLTVVAVLVVALRSRPEKLRFTVGVERAQGLDGHWIRAYSGDKIPVRFGDGSSIDMSWDARGRVVRVTPFGATVTLETGSLHADFVARSGADWTVAAGPFNVHSAGADVDLAWDPDGEVLTIGVQEGAVNVSGPLLTDPQRVEARQSLLVSLTERQALLSPLPP